MKIGILKEPEFENRVALLPDHVKTLIDLKATVSIEKGAGKKSFFADNSYNEKGAEIVSREQVLNDSNLIVSIHHLSTDEYKKLKESQAVLTAFNPLFNSNIVKQFVESGITSFSMDMVPRTTRAQSMDILSSMATVAGYKAVLEAANHLPSFFPMFMTAAGTIKPSKVLVLGAGVAGLQAIATARKLGAVVEAFDVRSAVKEEVQSLGAKFIEVEGALNDSNAGGYAVEQTEEFKQKQQQLIQEHAKKANVVITTAQIPGRKAPLLITKDTVENMMPGSVIIDLAASTGGNCELTKNNEAVEINHVKIIGNSNYASAIPSDASKMYGNNIINFMKLIIDESGNLKLNFTDEIVRGTCITYNKEIINERVKSNK
ncbi:MAG: NAD(P) transhydrogenase subunit alpha [Bacteroidetes bacterium GWC2_33_15]|nr:MAG: NAD(P) transhydrogenase subunit alpha [Bacteroidetes bacterium GWA2_33_15]OFX51062.1 MAG: NAD(P) transhydrogenase subunit alpha [Bacteroidetes bacterium GWC2_33_15]OFX66505.1 MAG: NAD(P) transhydrogenase subunit alpha [Bacteroidetes bacterium GWB2_32_14]OFX70270.1 MAG: NAD(P) transhydrogenase subunit alpha [Bacteroidetes bacterium GWD2_33_33]HAN17267.1 Re/Si-specific NAD(P)(+) transhydrogenase subunit alpha [Bacteroidales bacterium]